MCSFYLAVRKEANSHLVDGTGHRPHYSLRTLCRALKYVATNPCNSVQRSLYEVGGLRDIISLKGQLTQIQRKNDFSFTTSDNRDICWHRWMLKQDWFISVFSSLSYLTCCFKYLVTLFLSPPPACIPSWQSPMVAGFLPELPDSAGQKFPPSGPETSVSAHSDGEHQVSQTSKMQNSNNLATSQIVFIAFIYLNCTEMQAFNRLILET